MPNQGKRRGGQGHKRTAGGGRSGGSSGRGGGHAAFDYQYPDSKTQGSGGKMTRSQSLGTPSQNIGVGNSPGLYQNKTIKGSAGTRHMDAKKGYTTQHVKLVSGLVNPYLFVELEKSSVWKVIVPHGQSFGKQFLAGLEAWAHCIVDEYKKSPGSTPSRDATTSVAQHQHLPSPPMMSTPQSIPLPAEPTSLQRGMPTDATTFSSPAGGPLDWASYLTGGSTQQYSSTGTSALNTPATDGNFYKPVLDQAVQESSPAAADVEQLLAHGYVGDLGDNGTDADTAVLSASAPATTGLLHTPSSKLPVHAEDVDEGVDVPEDEQEEAQTQEFDDADYVDPYDDDRDADVLEDEVGEDDALLDKDQGGFEYSSLVVDDIKGDGIGRLDFDALDAQEVQPDVGVHRKRQASTSPYTPVAKRPAAVSADSTTPLGRKAVSTAQQSSSTLPSYQGTATNATVRVRVSIRLERQALTDSEMELFVHWYQERGCHLVEVSKLWLYDNRLGDAGAACVAQLMHPGLTEIHLSHNAMTTQGAELLMASIPMDRAAAQGRPLWLRMEWNIINVDALLNCIKQQKQLRGLKVDIPKVVTGDGDNGHDMNLKLVSSPHKLGSDMHVCLPWVACQKQAPSEAAVLQDVKNIYRSAGLYSNVSKHSAHAKVAQSNFLATPSAPPPPPPQPSVDVLSAATSQLSLSDNAALSAVQPSSPPPPPLPPASVLAAAVSPTKPSTTSTKNTKVPQQLPAKTAAGVSAISELLEQGSQWPSGPLLLFPDTSALLSMIGANIDLKKPVFCLSSLMKLARNGRFGRQGLPSDQQVFIVIADSVMKQLDGLKSLPNARTSIRWFLSEGLEECGPAGLDFLTVLGAHEGEGLAMSTGALGSTGSRSPFLSSKGQQVDFRIVEVALFFMNEVLKAANNGSNETMDSGSNPPLPVMLLSNDNAQISTARSHGLPAYRLYSESQTAEGVLRSLLQDEPSSMHQQPCVLSACLLRGLFGPVATTGLGSAVPAVPLQESFDSVVAAMQGVVGALHTAQLALSGITEAVTNSSSAITSKEVEALLAVIAQHLHTPLPLGLSNADEDIGASPTLLSQSLSGLLSALQGPLSQWEARCRTHQQPSRVLQWMSTSG